MTDFHEALDRRLLLALEEQGLERPTEIQATVLPPALAGRDLRISSPTGSGKTLAYLLPALQFLLGDLPSQSEGPLVLVLVPTRELARQVLKEARQLLAKTRLRAEALTGGADFRFQQSLLRRNPELLIGTPGRLIDHLGRGSLLLSQVRILVLDEADRMLEMGFREDVMTLAEACPAQRQTLLLSATLHDSRVTAVSEALQRDPLDITGGLPAGIVHQRILADSQGHKDQLLQALAADSSGRQLVFANKRATAARLAKLLQAAGVRAACLHGELTTEERKAVMQRFNQGGLQVVVASDLAARGLDVDDIQRVIHYDTPFGGDDYLHRAGRTGRAGASGESILFVDASEWNRMISIQGFMQIAFAPRSVPGLKARYAGPKKQRASGKAAGTRKKKSDAAKKTTGGKRKADTATRKPGKKGTGTGKPAAKRARGRLKAAPAVGNDGFAPLMKKKPGRTESSD
ncbi:DEAD/DEAH box helicase [Haliea atlantica]|jgi:superfamily II DNA/RNA helicase|nr:RNA helicase [Haliea sp.]